MNALTRFQKRPGALPFENSALASPRTIPDSTVPDPSNGQRAYISFALDRTVIVVPSMVRWFSFISFASVSLC